MICVLRYAILSKRLHRDTSLTHQHQSWVEINLHFAYSLGTVSCYKREILDSSWELLILSETFCFPEKYPDSHETLPMKIFLHQARNVVRETRLHSDPEQAYELKTPTSAGLITILKCTCLSSLSSHFFSLNDKNWLPHSSFLNFLQTQGTLRAS